MSKRITLEDVVELIVSFKDETLKRFDDVDKRFDVMDRNFDEADKRFDDLAYRLDSRTGSLETRMITLEEKMDRGFAAVREDIDVLASDILKPQRKTSRRRAQ